MIGMLRGDIFNVYFLLVSGSACLVPMKEKVMNILIVGATRGIGRQLLEQALTSGHAVTALVRDPQRLAAQHERLRVIKGDILDSDSVALAMAGQDAVCCTIGVKAPWIRVTVFSEGTRNLLQAMKKTGARRLIGGPGFLTNGPSTENYRVLTNLTGVTAGWISRADVAHFILKELASNQYS